jgi:thioredoxin 1
VTLKEWRNEMTENKKCSCGSGGDSCCGKHHSRSWIILAVVVVAGLIAVKELSTRRAAPSAAPVHTAVQTNGLPRLVDLGATKCIPCKMMAPILEDLKKAYVGKLDVQFIDVWEDPDAGKKYEINLIPTQIFLDAEGKELFRHEGFFSKEEILAKWKEFGVELVK